MTIDWRKWRSSFSRPLPSGLALGWFVAGLASVLAFFSQGHKGDLSYWHRWLGELQSGGYAALDANYPPLLLHWLALGAGILDLVRLGNGNPLLVKIWVQLPIWLAWMLLLYQVARALDDRGITPMTSGAFWLVAVNPAILLDGPIWGQVDLLPWIPLSLGLLAHARGRHRQGPMWFCLALAVKFQSIVLAPIFVALFLRAVYADRKVLWGVVAAAGVTLLSFLPFILVGRGWAQAGAAYWGNLGRYPHATLNAANLWKLLTPPGFRGQNPLPGFEEFAWMSPSKLGLFLFGSISLFVFVAAFRKSANVWALGTLSMFGFFAFSSAMHERYLFMAVPLSAMWAAFDDKGKPWLGLSTAVVGLNIAFRLFPTDVHEWTILSAVIVLAVPLLLLHSIGGRLPGGLWAFWDARPRRTLLLCVGVPFLIWGYEINHTLARSTLLLEVNEVRSMVRLEPTTFSQEWGQPRWRYRFWHPPVKFSSRSVTSGIKTHAMSKLLYDLPAGRYRLQGWAGADYEAKDGADMVFEIKVDDASVWTSPTIEMRSPPVPFDVTVSGPAVLGLYVDALRSNKGDHALWGDVTIRRLE